MAPRSAAQARCALCGAKEVSEPRGEEKFCRDCWDKKIAVEDIVAREFALKRYIRAHSAEKYLVYHSTQKRPCGQLIVVDDGYDLFLSLILYPTFAWDEPAYHLEGDPDGRSFAELLVDVVAAEVIEPWGGGQMAPRDLPVGQCGARGLERRAVTVGAGRPPVEVSADRTYNLASPWQCLREEYVMTRLNRALLFGFMVAIAATVACGGGEPAEEGAAEAAGPAPPDPEAVAAASRLAARLGSGVQLVPTQRGLAEIAYTQPVARRESGFIVTSMRIKNLAENAIAGFQVDEFWFDADGNTVTGDQVRFREPLLTGEIRDIELRVPRVAAMDRSNYEFSHQNGDIKATLFDEIEDPPEPEEEEGEADSDSDDAR